MAQLQRLVDEGNTVVVVEHEMRVVVQSDWVIDMGPGAGAQGGRIVAAGTPAQVAQARDSRTAPYLADCLREQRASAPPRDRGALS
jgi:excinuclease ABC subunit A